MSDQQQYSIVVILHCRLPHKRAKFDIFLSQTKTLYGFMAIHKLSYIISAGARALVLLLSVMQVKRREGGWTPQPQLPPSSRMGSFGRKPNMRPWRGPIGRRQGPMNSDYDYSAPRQNFGRHRPFDRDGRPGDFYGPYDDMSPGQNAYSDYFQPYEYGDMREMLPSRDRHLPYDEHGTSSDEADESIDRSSYPKFSSQATTVSASPGDDQLSFATRI